MKNLGQSGSFGKSTEPTASSYSRHPRAQTSLAACCLQELFAAVGLAEGLLASSISGDLMLSVPRFLQPFLDMTHADSAVQLHNHS